MDPAHNEQPMTSRLLGGVWQENVNKHQPRRTTRLGAITERLEDVD